MAQRVQPPLPPNSPPPELDIPKLEIIDDDYNEKHENINPVKSTLNNMAQRVQPPLPPNSPPPELDIPKLEIIDDDNNEKHENINPVKSTLNNMAQRVQPPLPPNSPPPELDIPKLEIIDDDYNEKHENINPVKSTLNNMAQRVQPPLPPNSPPPELDIPKLDEYNEKHENINPVKSTLNNMAQRVQPPLPPNSPPPELDIPKLEIVDDEFNDEPVLVSPTNVKEDVCDGPAKVMCHQFIRGTCVRGAACRYVHEVILNQLPEVYTFCKNFQNKKCKLSKCKFVHASVFEKEHFYRTGYLPPHSLAHLKESNIALAPSKEIDGLTEPLPLLPPPVLLGLASVPSQRTTDSRQHELFGNMPAHNMPALRQGSPIKRGWSDMGPGLTEPLPLLPPPVLLGLASLPSQRTTDSRQHELFNMPALRQGSPIKRGWSDMGPAMAAQEHNSGEPLFKKCKSCDINELSFQCAKANSEKLREQLEEIVKEKCQLAEKQNSVNDVLITAFNQMNPSEPISRSEETNFDNLIIEYYRRFSEMNGQQKVILKQIVLDLLEKQSGSSVSR